MNLAKIDDTASPKGRGPAKAETTSYLLRDTPPFFQEFKKMYPAGPDRVSKMNISGALRQIIEDVASGKEELEEKQTKRFYVTFKESDWTVFLEKCKASKLSLKEGIVQAIRKQLPEKKGIKSNDLRDQ